MGIGDGVWGIGDWGLGPIPNPQSPIPNPQSPFFYNNLIIYLFIKIKFYLKKLINKSSNYISKIKNGKKAYDKYVRISFSEQQQ